MAHKSLAAMIGLDTLPRDRMAAKQRHLSLLLLLFVVLAVALLPSCSGFVMGKDNLRMHSLYPPMLEKYWDNGMYFWAFGSNSVVTDDYVRLTGTDPTMRGFLWNRHPNNIRSFELNVTLQMRQRDSAWLADGSDGGLALWSVMEPVRTVPAVGSDLFGYHRRFSGVGVVLDHSNEISLLIGDGTEDIGVDQVKSTRRGFCKIGTVNEYHITLSLRYERKELNVYYVVHYGNEPLEEDYGNAVLCVTVTDIEPAEKSFFGVTASNANSAQAIHEIHSIFMTPLGEEAIGLHVAEEEAEAAQRLFSFEEERKLQALHTKPST